MKTRKFLGTLAIALALGLTACGGGDKPATSSKHTHKWVQDETKTNVEATCQQEGITYQVCSICGEKQEKKVSKKAHTWGDPTVITAATCTEAGSQGVICTVCGTSETQSVPALGHDWGAWVDVTAATCTEAGEHKHTCSRCEEVESETVAALGHDWGEWEELTAPTCTEKGSHKHKCSRCDIEETEDIDALGHDIQLIGDDTEPEAGKAKVRVYTCANNCGTTYLGFKANEVSDESKEHLVIGEDGGAAFWGRPIGNALALDANGTSVNQQNNEVVYCTTETGDFFEYVFDLTADQVETLGEKTLLYCDAKPANYLNGADFFAYSASNDDWTPGYYIDGGEGHYEVDEDSNPVMVKDHARATEAGVAGEELETEVKMGKRIEDYRYILYVDGEVKAFDDSIKNPTHGSNTNMRREEFVLPYVFNLHVGENRISLRMSGGYRSTFYNFTFRPVEEGGDDTPAGPTIVNEWSLDTIKANRTDSGWDADKDWGADGKGFKFNKVGGFTVKYTSESAQKVTLQLKISVKYSNRSKTGFWAQADEAEVKTKVEFNDATITGTEPDFTGVTNSSVSDSGTLSIPEWFDIIELNLIAGENTLTISYVAGGYSFYMCGARLVK